MVSRLKLHKQLVEIADTDRVYFQAPSKTLTYPCIIYDKNPPRVIRANNKIYKKKDSYTFTYITKNPDDETPDKFLGLSYCSSDRVYRADGLYHHVFTIFV